MEEEEDFEARQRTRTAANQGTEAALAKAKDNQAKVVPSHRLPCRAAVHSRWAGLHTFLVK